MSSSISQSIQAVADFKKEVLSGNISVAQKKLDALKVLII